MNYCMVITIHNKEYNVKEAKTEEELKQGLKGIEELPENEGMLFYFDPPREVSMTMQDTLLTLDQIFINEDQEVISVVTRKPKDENLVTIKDVAYVLELNANSGVRVGDEIEFEDDSKEYVMKILAPDGSVQMNLKGGERIFRRLFSKQLVQWVKKAKEVELDEKAFNKICIRIGKKMFRELKAQNEREPEYVELKS